MNRWMQTQIFFRSFFLQAGWNFVKYQNLGFAFVMLPFLRKLYKDDPDTLSTVLKRYLDTFNTHPVMASYCFGAMAKQEENIAAAKSVTDYKEEVLQWTGSRRGLSITAASIGDRLFWGTLKPLTLLLAILVWMLCGVNFLETKQLSSPAAWAIFTGPAVAFVLYNTLAWWIRWKGIAISYHADDSSCFGLTRFDWNRAIYHTKRLGLLFTTGLILLGIYFYFSRLPGLDVHFVARGILILFFILLSFITHRFKIPNVYLYLTTVIIFTIVCLF